MYDRLGAREGAYAPRAAHPRPHGRAAVILSAVQIPAGCTGTLVELPSVSLRFKIVLRRGVNKTLLALRIALIGSGSLPCKIGLVLALPLRAAES